MISLQGKKYIFGSWPMIPIPTSIPNSSPGLDSVLKSKGSDSNQVRFATFTFKLICNCKFFQHKYQLHCIYISQTSRYMYIFSILDAVDVILQHIKKILEGGIAMTSYRQLL